jgi:ribonuclease P protein component
MRRSPDFAAAVRRGRRAGRSRLVVHLLSTGTDSLPLVGFVVSRAVGGSVVRNRVERRLRHLVADRLDRLPDGSHLVVRAAPPASASTSEQLGEDLDAALRSALAPRAPRRPRPAGDGRP